MMSRCYKLACFLVAASVFGPQITKADAISVVSSVSGSPGAFSYSYEVDNQTSVGLLLFSLTVTGDVGPISAPSGWVTATGTGGAGGTVVEWISTDVSSDVPAFGSLMGFSFTSDSGPGAVTFSTFDENFSEFDGQTNGPVASTVPEPNSMMLLCACLLAIFIGRPLVARKRSTARVVFGW